MKHIKHMASMLALAGMAAAPNAFAECGDIQMAEMDWASAELMANVDKIILEEGYGCNIELVPGATMTTFASMENKAQPDLAAELWINAVREPLEIALESGEMVIINDGPITDLGEGWWLTPEFAAAHPELDTVEKVLAHPELFPDVEEPEKGAFVGCPAGWGCQLVNANLFRAFDMEAKGWKLVDPGSAAGLDGSIARAVERSEPWFGYYWSPTAIIGKYKMVKVPFEVEFAGTDNWDGCIVKEECDDPQATAWTASEVRTVVTNEFMDKAGEDVSAYIQTRVFPGEIMNEMLVFMTENQAVGEDAAYEFLDKHGDLWKGWVSEEAAEKIEKAL